MPVRRPVQPARQTLLHRRIAQHLRVPHADQHRAFRVQNIIKFKPYRAQLILRPLFRSHDYAALLSRVSSPRRQRPVTRLLNCLIDRAIIRPNRLGRKQSRWKTLWGPYNRKSRNPTEVPVVRGQRTPQQDGSGSNPGVSRLQRASGNFPLGAELGANVHQSVAGPDNRVSPKMAGEFMSALVAPFSKVGAVPELLLRLERDQRAASLNLLQVERGPAVFFEDIRYNTGVQD